MSWLGGNYRLKRNVGFIFLGLALGWGIFTFLVYPNLSLL